MNGFREIDPRELQDNVFRLIGSDWMLITAADKDKVNTMTASWGGVGELWNKNVAFTFIRPTRYTYEFVENFKQNKINFSTKLLNM
jgi:flavin reductase (DIM6/NTAB) family NADH-FMN oxidoreductase RutF